jgi:hypothetical protein
MKFQRLEKVVAAIFCAVFSLTVFAAEPAPQLILTDARLAELKELAKSDETLQHYVADVLKRADGFLKAKPLERVLVGPRLLFVSRDMMARTYALGLAYRWTGDKKYLAKAEQNLSEVCAFENWNPSHYLDVAEMTHAVAIGYDWLRRDLKPEVRETVRKKLIELGVGDGAKRVREGAAHWTNGHNNWTQVCCSGLIVGALAVRDTDPALWEELREPLLEGLRKANKLYAPEGAWDEGTAYWHYATSYLVYGIAALETALGTDFDLSKAEGLSTAAYFPVQLNAPSQQTFCFADNHAGRKRNGNAELFWLANRFKLPDVLADEHRAAQDAEAKPLHVIWYAPPPANPPALPTAELFNGRVPVAVMRTAWGDPKAWWVAVKGGDNMVSHGHLDLGSFEFEAEGERWISELGSDDYNLPGYFGGKRWTYYRLQTVSHNVFTLDGTNQPPKGGSKLNAFDAGGDVASATVDLSGAYPVTKQAVRTVSLDRKNLSLTISDKIELDGRHEILWGVTTRAKIKLNGNRATLEQGGKRITAVIESPKGAKFSTSTCERPEPEEANKGYNRLEVKLSDATGTQNIVVKFAR